MLISSHSFEGVDSFDWFQELPNIADYDIIILDTPRILTFWSLGGKLKSYAENQYFISKIDQIDEKVKSNLLLIKQKLVEILEFDVTVYVLHIPNIIIGTKARVLPASVTAPDMPGRSIDVFVPKKLHRSKWVLESFVNTDEWCPISISTVAEKGKKILVKNQAYEEYFKDFKGWQYRFDIDSLDISDFAMAHSDEWKVIAMPQVVATNKVEKPIAVEFVPLFCELGSAEHDAWPNVPTKRGGSLVLLPVIDIYHTEPLVEVLLRRIKGFEKTPPPGWVSSIEIPGEVPLKNEIAVEKQNLEAVESKIKGLEDSLTELEKYKGLLYETGLPLQELVKSTLQKLGAEIKPSIVTDEFIIGIGGKEALIEVKGLTRSISKDDIGQLFMDMGEHLKATGENIKGILIGNAWRLLPLEQRDTHDKPIFPHNIVKIAWNQDIGLISTTELLKAFCKTLEEPQYKKEVLNKIIAGKGVITF